MQQQSPRPHRRGDIRRGTAEPVAAARSGGYVGRMAPAARFQPHKHPRGHKDRSAPEDRLGPPTLALTPDLERFIDDWVDRAHPHTVVEPVGDPEGFVALCPPARGAIAFADTEQEAINEMRDVLSGWAYFSLDSGQNPPQLPPPPSPNREVSQPQTARDEHSAISG